MKSGILWAAMLHFCNLLQAQINKTSQQPPCKHANSNCIIILISTGSAISACLESELSPSLCSWGAPGSIMDPAMNLMWYDTSYKTFKLCNCLLSASNMSLQWELVVFALWILHNHPPWVIKGQYMQLIYGKGVGSSTNQRLHEYGNEICQPTPTCSTTPAHAVNGHQLGATSLKCQCRWTLTNSLL